MTPAVILARVIAGIIMVAAIVAAVVEARPAWLLMGAAAALAFLSAA